MGADAIEHAVDGDATPPCERGFESPHARRFCYFGLVTQRRWWVGALIAVAVMAAAFPIEAVIAGLLGGGKIGGVMLGGLLGGLMLAYASLPVIATVVVLGSLPFLRPRFGPIATGLYVALFGTVVGGVFAGTLYNGGRIWQAMFVGPGLWFWIIAAVAGFLTLWVRRDRAGALSAAVAAACIVVLSISAVSIAHGT
jgi:hypothetical protein